MSKKNVCPECWARLEGLGPDPVCRTCRIEALTLEKTLIIAALERHLIARDLEDEDQREKRSRASAIIAELRGLRA